MIISIREAQARFIELERLAAERGLSYPPPYPNPAKRQAWINGYEAALSDIACGNLSRSLASGDEGAS